MPEPEPEPTPTAKLDIDLAHHLIRTRRLQYGIAGVVVLLLAAVAFLVGHVLAQNIGGECQFFESITAVPVLAQPQGKTPATSQLGTNIVAGARNAYVGLSCKPPLPPPSPALIILSHRYHVVLRT